MPYPPPPARRGMPTWAKVLLVLGGAGILGVAALFGVLIYIGVNSPGTAVIPGRQLKSKFVKQINQLGVLEPGEQIEYFYSDAMIGIEDGFYLVTDRAVILYSRNWTPPVIRVDYADIRDTSTSFSTSWFIDSVMVLTLDDGTVISVPAATENGGDKRMYDAIDARVAKGDQRGAP